jgi:prevent-host-death family protein
MRFIDVVLGEPVAAPDEQLPQQPAVETRRRGIMKIASVADVRAHFSAYLKAAEHGPVIITRNGKAVVVLVPAGDEDHLERLVLAHSPKLQAILEAARQRFRSGKGIPHDTFWQEVEAKATTDGTKRSTTRKRSPTRGRKTHGAR